MSRAFRYNLILVLVALGTALAAAAGWRFARASAPVAGPIVLVSIDSLRPDHLPVYGASHPATPALTALAADGVVFDRAYSHVPLTLPAHVALLSGRLPADTGVRDNIGASVPPALRLISTMLADRGYTTGGIVSSYALRRATGVGSGFAFFDDELEPLGIGRTAAGNVGAAVGQPPPDGAPVVHRDGAESEKRAERWLSGAGTARAFLFLHLSEPHAPYAPPKAFAQPAGEGSGDAEGQAAYDGEIAYADDLLGRLVAYLKKQQLYDESTIIVVGDHGESLGAHGEAGHGLLVLDDTLRVPLIIKRAGAEGRGTRVGELVQHVDIVPTILDLVNAPIPGDLPGRSLRPLLTGSTLGPRVAYAESMFGETQFGWTATRTVTDGRFRYVSGPTPQLFDLERDPESREDISASHPEDVARLAKALESFTTPAANPEPVDLRAALQDVRLLSLGFIGPRVFASGAPGTPGTFDEAPLERPADAGSEVQTYGDAMAAYAERRWSPALERLRALVRTAPRRMDYWAALARVADRAQRYDIAADAWRHIVLADTEATAGARLEAHLNLAWTSLRARRADDVRQHADAALALATGEMSGIAADTALAARVRAHELLVRAALLRRDAVAARAQAQLLVALDEQSPWPGIVEARQAFERGRFEAALDLLDEASAQAKDRTVFELELWRGETLTKLDRLPEAEEAYLAELRRTLDHTRAFIALATMYHEQMRSDELSGLVTSYTQSVRTSEAYDSAIRLLSGFGDRKAADHLRDEAAQVLAVRPAALTQQ